jgi:alanyl-tRNA synthetase
LGYETDEAEAQILKLIKDGVKVSSAKADDKVQLIFNQTPFYAESGGQVGDQGYVQSSDCMIQINDTKKFAGLFIHSGIVSEDPSKKGIVFHYLLTLIEEKELKLTILLRIYYMKL